MDLDPEQRVKMPELTGAQADAYLSALGVSRTPPSRSALCELVRAQVTRVPFENVSKLLYRNQRSLRDIPGLELYLEGIRRFHFGGTCYPNSFHFFRLLRALGYEAALCGAAMRSGEDVHAAIRVALEGHDLLVDVGYGAPFFEPLPLASGGDIVVGFGRDRYVLKPRNTEGRSRLELHRDGTLIHGYLLDPTPRPTEHFDRVVRDSFGDAATFMNAVVLIRHSLQGSVAIHNLSLVRTSADLVSIESLADRTELIAAIEREFGIPSKTARDAIAGLGPFGDVYR